MHSHVTRTLPQDLRYKDLLRKLHTVAPHVTFEEEEEEDAAAAQPMEEKEEETAPVPAPLAVVAVERQLNVRPVVAARPASPPPSAPAPSGSYLVEGTPEGGESKLERKQRLDRNKKRRKRANPAVREAEAKASWKRRNPGKDESERKRRK